MKGSIMMNYESDIKSADYLYMVCREHPLLVISTDSGIGKYHFSCIGFKQNKMLIEFNLVMDNDYHDSKWISENIGKKYYLTVPQFLNAYKKYAIA
jgi:hypothetical protein|tara:strand:+ start:1419 stop:1706 length:288 start_codon:yes stop_codon:yes gene_type:complete